MNEVNEIKEPTYNILVYGIERRGLTTPTESHCGRNFMISFEPFDTRRRFDEYDGVIMFQGIFENFEQKNNWMSDYISHLSDYISHSCYQDELDKRENESQLLIEKGGFLCFLLIERIIDYLSGIGCRSSDLTKCRLNYYDIYRTNNARRITQIDIKSDNFRQFLKINGAAWSFFRKSNESMEWGVIAKAEGDVVGMVINRNEYYIPTLIPDNRPEVINKYFAQLADSLIKSNNTLRQTLPDWIEKYSFDEEAALSQEREALNVRIYDIDIARRKLSGYKSVLAFRSSELVVSVSELFAKGFQIAVDTKDEFREDLKLLDDGSNPICLCEVKGTNAGVKSNYINQADTHRERSGYKNNFPILLIINTHIKYARSIKEKDREIENEQILHAVRMKVLILRTIDLLGLLKLHLNGNITKNEAVALFTNNHGWLRVSGEEISIVTDKTANDKA